MATNESVFLGIRGSVVSLDKTTGQRLWERKLKGSDFVSLLVDGNHILAGAQGEIFCLDATTGETLWHDALKGYGWGLMSIATRFGNTNAALARVQAQQDSDASSVSGVGAV